VPYGNGVASVERYGPGEQALSFEPGDFLLAHRHHPIARLISFAQKRRFRGADAQYAHWSHCALVVGADGELVESESTGVTRSPVSKYKADEYHLVRLGPQFVPQARERAVRYARAQVGQPFGYLALFGSALYLVFGWPVGFSRDRHVICSGLVTLALQKGGLVPDLNPALVLPADLAKLFGANYDKAWALKGEGG